MNQNMQKKFQITYKQITMNLIVSEKDLINTIYKIPNIYDEPFADSSQIPTYLISKFARQKNKGGTYRRRWR